MPLHPVTENFVMARKTPEIDTQSPQYQELADYLKRVLAQDQKFQGLTHFRDIEDYAIAAGNILAREIYSQSAKQLTSQAESLHPCPDCGRQCSGSFESRDLQTRCGPVSIKEAKYHCPRCRRDFFPLPTKSGSDSSKLQPKTARSHGHNQRRLIV